MKQEMMEKYGIGKRQPNARGISSNVRDSKVKFAADLGIDPTGLNSGAMRRSDSAQPKPDEGRGGTPVRNKNANPIVKNGMPLRKTGDPVLLGKSLGSADPRISKGSGLIKRSATSKAATALLSSNPWADSQDSKPTAESSNPDKDNLERRNQPRNLKPLTVDGQGKP